MAIVDYSAPAIPERVIGKAEKDGSYRRPQTNGNGQPKTRVKVWANFGCETKGFDGRLITTPLGTAIDTMEPADTSGSNSEIVAERKARNKFLASLQKIGASLEPGTRFRLSNVYVELYRVKDDADTSVEESEEEIDFMDLLTAPPQKIAAE